MPTETWNASKIIKDHGGVSDLKAKLKNFGYEVPEQTIRAWERRSNIPSQWLAVIMTMRGENPNGWITEDIF